MPENKQEGCDIVRLVAMRADRRKPWRAPVVLLSDLAESEAGVVTTVTEGAFAYGS